MQHADRLAVRSVSEPQEKDEAALAQDKARVRTVNCAV